MVCEDPKKAAGWLFEHSCSLINILVIFVSNRIVLLLSLCVFVIRVGGVGGFAPPGPEGSAFGSSSHLHESCLGAGLGEGPWGAPAPSTSANTHIMCGLDCTDMELIIRGKCIIYGTGIWAGLVSLLWYW